MVSRWRILGPRNHKVSLASRPVQSHEDSSLKSTSLLDGALCTAKRAVCLLFQPSPQRHMTPNRGVPMPGMGGMGGPMPGPSYSGGMPMRSGMGQSPMDHTRKRLLQQQQQQQSLGMGGPRRV